jgi:hypothetical protein
MITEFVFYAVTILVLYGLITSTEKVLARIPQRVKIDESTTDQRSRLWR